MIKYTKRLIEVDLPIRRISAHARREKSIRHGHISTLHIWWARRPLAACRAVICAALWPDPADEACPQAFRDAAALALCDFAEQVRTNATLAGLCRESWSRWLRTTSATLRGDNPAAWADMRYALLDFIADFANWDASTVPEFLETARLLTRVAHLALTDLRFSIADLRLDAADGTHAQIENLKSKIENTPRPLVVDPFAGGGAIPLEALRVGADAFASDLNPVAVLLNKVVLEYIPKYGNAEFTMRNAEGEEVTFHGLAEAVRYWGDWIKRQAEAELAEFYPKDPDGATPIAYLWARTITCEGPGCGAGVPLMRSLWLAKKGERSVALRMVPDSRARHVSFEIIENAKVRDVLSGTVRHGSATCPICGYTTPVQHVREQLRSRRGGATDALLIAVRCNDVVTGERRWRLANAVDQAAAVSAKIRLTRLELNHQGPISLVPDEKMDIRGIRHTWGMIYGMDTWGDVFTPRQALANATLAHLVEEVPIDCEPDLKLAVLTSLGLAVDRMADFNASLCVLNSTGGRGVVHVFGRQALPMVWDFLETNPFNTEAANWDTCIDVMTETAAVERLHDHGGFAQQANATQHPLPNDSASAFVTDPPYYDAVPYSYLSDFFYVWLKRTVAKAYPDLLKEEAVPKDEEIIVDRPHELSNSTKDIAFYERELTKAFAEGRRVLTPSGIAVVVFAIVRQVKIWGQASAPNDSQ